MFNPWNCHFLHDRQREYLHCPVCDLIFVHPAHFLTLQDERERYDLHNNDPDDTRYRSFLSRLCSPMLNHISPHSKGFDFGSGPGPLLSIMFAEQGHEMSIYDFFYAPDLDVFNQHYDFITSSETIEHLHHPQVELDRLWSCLKPGGILGLMTGIRYDEIDFSSWYYIRDETHVVFYSPKTFDWLAQHWRAELQFIGDSVVIFRKAGKNHTPASGQAWI
ncbi:MAG: class I SAM-dependent methyltransferase [Candidatus Marinimicrobia bacterium]|nr:class I SAM-dependent methyltransferase [Candidatus Neomarinimicrobiota bacterium]